jgi:hypothetical protein
LLIFARVNEQHVIIKKINHSGVFEHKTSEALVRKTVKLFGKNLRKNRFFYQVRLAFFANFRHAFFQGFCTESLSGTLMIQ